MAKSAFTLFEAMVAMIVAGTIVTVLFIAFKPGNVKQEALQKAGLAASPPTPPPAGSGPTPTA